MRGIQPKRFLALLGGNRVWTRLETGAESVNSSKLGFKFAGGRASAGHVPCFVNESNPKKATPPNSWSRSGVTGRVKAWLRKKRQTGVLVTAIPAHVNPDETRAQSVLTDFLRHGRTAWRHFGEMLSRTVGLLSLALLSDSTVCLARGARVLRNMAIWMLATVLYQSPLAMAQEKYPAKIIRVLTAAPGSNHDWGARLLAQELTPRIGQRVVVENRGSISVEIVAKDTPPDGYTLLFYGAYVWLQPLLTKANWDPLEDLAPISLAISSPNILAVHPSLPVKSTRDLIALARARPDALNYGAGGGGSSQHIAAELFKYMAQVKIVRVNYKGAGPSMLGLITGEVQMMFAALGPAMPHVKGGKVRALAVTTPKPTPLASELPLVADILPGYVSESAIGLFAPKKTPMPIVKLLASHVQQGVKAADPKIIANNGVEVVAGSPEDFARFIRADLARMGNVIKSASFSN